jgi:hypothetical protein
VRELLPRGAATLAALHDVGKISAGFLRRCPAWLIQNQLAGANHASQITNALAEDWVLTGLEASLLNLQGTELVILSACDSGTGEVQIGEGVMSLRRAFRIAGAQTVPASPARKPGGKRSCPCCTRRTTPALISGQPSHSRVSGAEPGRRAISATPITKRNTLCRAEGGASRSVRTGTCSREEACQRKMIWP